MKKYILAVSGGPDSMALLYKYRKRAIAVCTVNYNKRKNSSYDVSLVNEFCKKYNIEHFIKIIDKKVYTKNKIDNFQSFARKLRYDFFCEVANKVGCNNLLVAHNLNDHLETAYMKKKRNSQSLYYGIKQKSKYKDLNIYRPLLCYQKKTLERFCRTHNIKFAIDESNASDIYERNRVRKIINNWSQEQLIDFIREIRKYNKKNKKLSKKVDNIFNKWIETDFNYNYVKMNSEQEKYHLIYKLLSYYDETNISSNKINNVICFLENNSNPTKKYRLENKKYLIKEKNIIKVF